MAIIFALFLPATPYDGRNIREEELAKISNTEYLKTEKNLDGRIVYTYIRRISDENGEYQYIPRKTTANDVCLIMSDNFAEPKVTISESGFDGNFWTFSLGNTKTNYVFVIPTNNLIEYEK